jgi:cytidylate kinase
MTRTISPLKQAEDAIFLDTTGKSIDECVNFLFDELNKIIKRKGVTVNLHPHVHHHK